MLSWEPPLVARKLSARILQAGRNNAYDEFLGWYEADRPGPFSKLLVQEYRTRLEERGLAPSTINIHVTAIRRLAAEAAGAGWLLPEVAAGIAGLRGACKLASAGVSGSERPLANAARRAEPEH